VNIAPATHEMPRRQTMRPARQFSRILSPVGERAGAVRRGWARDSGAWERHVYVARRALSLAQAAE